MRKTRYNFSEDENEEMISEASEEETEDMGPQDSDISISAPTPHSPVDTVNLIALVDPDKVEAEDITNIADATGSSEAFVERIVDFVQQSGEEAASGASAEEVQENFSRRAAKACKEYRPRINFADEMKDDEVKVAEVADILPVLVDDVIDNMPAEEIAQTISAATGVDPAAAAAVIDIAREQVAASDNLEESSEEVEDVEEDNDIEQEDTEVANFSRNFADEGMSLRDQARLGVSVGRDALTVGRLAGLGAEAAAGAGAAAVDDFLGQVHGGSKAVVIIGGIAFSAALITKIVGTVRAMLQQRRDMELDGISVTGVAKANALFKDLDATVAKQQGPIQNMGPLQRQAELILTINDSIMNDAPTGTFSGIFDNLVRNRMGLLLVNELAGLVTLVCALIYMFKLTSDKSKMGAKAFESIYSGVAASSKNIKRMAEGLSDMAEGDYDSAEQIFTQGINALSNSMPQINAMGAGGRNHRTVNSKIKLQSAFEHGAAIGMMPGAGAAGGYTDDDFKKRMGRVKLLGFTAATAAFYMITNVMLVWYLFKTRNLNKLPYRARKAITELADIVGSDVATVGSQFNFSAGCIGDDCEEDDMEIYDEEDLDFCGDGDYCNRNFSIDDGLRRIGGVVAPTLGRAGIAVQQNLRGAGDQIARASVAADDYISSASNWEKAGLIIGGIAFTGLTVVKIVSTVKAMLQERAEIANLGVNGASVAKANALAKSMEDLAAKAAGPVSPETMRQLKRPSELLYIMSDSMRNDTNSSRWAGMWGNLVANRKALVLLNEAAALTVIVALIVYLFKMDKDHISDEGFYDKYVNGKKQTKRAWRDIRDAFDADERGAIASYTDSEYGAGHGGMYQGYRAAAEGMSGAQKALTVAGIGLGFVVITDFIMAYYLLRTRNLSAMPPRARAALKEFVDIMDNSNSPMMQQMNFADRAPVSWGTDQQIVDADDYVKGSTDKRLYLIIAKWLAASKEPKTLIESIFRGVDKKDDVIKTAVELLKDCSGGSEKYRKALASAIESNNGSGEWNKLILRMGEKGKTLPETRWVIKAISVLALGIAKGLQDTDNTNSRFVDDPSRESRDALVQIVKNAINEIKGGFDFTRLKNNFSRIDKWNFAEAVEALEEAVDEKIDEDAHPEEHQEVEGDEGDEGEEHHEEESHEEAQPDPVEEEAAAEGFEPSLGDTRNVIESIQQSAETVASDPVNGQLDWNATNAGNAMAMQNELATVQGLNKVPTPDGVEGSSQNFSRRSAVERNNRGLLSLLGNSYIPNGR